MARIHPEPETAVNTGDAVAAAGALDGLCRRPSTALLALLTVALNAELILGLPPRVPAALELLPDSLRDWHWWRLLTGHWVHVSAGHFTIDMAAVTVIGLLYEPRYGWRWPALLLGASLAIGVVFCLFPGGLTSYRGMSGVAHGLFAAALLAEWRTPEHRAWQRGLLAGVGVFFLVKIGYEAGTGRFFWGMSQDVSLMGLPVPLAHATGAAAGFLTGALAPRMPTDAGR